MTTDNNILWKSTIIVALIASIGSIYASSSLTGSWALCDFPVTLWCVWLGILISTKVRIPVWLRVIILCFCIGLYFFFPHFNVQISGVSYILRRLGALKYVVLLLFGLGISRDVMQNNKFLENMLLFVAFLFMYVFMVLAEQRASYALYAKEAEPVAILLNMAKYGKAIPLAAAVLFCGRLSLSETIQNLLSKKGLYVTAFVLILALGIFDIVKSVVCFGQFHISVILTNPAVSIMIIFCIEKWTKSIQSKHQNI